MIVQEINSFFNFSSALLKKKWQNPLGRPFYNSGCCKISLGWALMDYDTHKCLRKFEVFFTLPSSSSHRNVTSGVGFAFKQSRIVSPSALWWYSLLKDVDQHISPTNKLFLNVTMAFKFHFCLYLGWETYYVGESKVKCHLIKVVALKTE